MICLFCKSDSTQSKSAEHIIPESLGNKEHILSKGVVCDKCNQYFAIKIEKPLLEKKYFMNARSRNNVESKKDIVPLGDAFIFGAGIGTVKFGYQDGKNIVIFENEEILNKIINKGKGAFIIQMNDEPEKNDLLLSRFLAKCALEFLAHSAIQYNSLNEIINKTELDSLREYARFGKGKFWNYHQRRIYDEEDRFVDRLNNSEPYEILHEIDFLHDEQHYLYFIIVIFGVEYVINMGENEIEMYLDWLLKNNNKSPVERLYEKRIIFNKIKYPDRTDLHPQ